MMDNNVICTIIMPSYNSEKYISNTIQSVLNQTFRNFELIIIDDESVDSSPKIIEKFAKSDERIIFLKNKKNLGVSVTRNIGLKQSRGRYIAFIDSDDEWFQEKLEKQINILESMKNVALVYSSYQIIDENDGVVKEKLVPKNVTFDNLLKENFICLSSICFDRRVLKDNFMSAKYFHEDFCFLLNGLRNNCIYYGISQVLTKYRVSRYGRSHNKKNAAFYRWLIYRKFLNLNLVESAYYFIWYFINGIKKYYLK